MTENEAVEAPALVAAGQATMMRWSAEACPFAVDIAAGVLASVRVRAREAFLSLPYGGVEVGGVLFGRVHPNARSPLRIEIVEERAVECAYARGPLFLLSGDEEEKLKARIGSAPRDPGLAGLSVVGFWVSHTRSDLELLPADRDLYGKFFPNPWQVALVLRPANGELTRAGFFFRDGLAVAQHTALEFYAETGLPVELAGPPTLDATPEVEEAPVVREMRPPAIANPYSILQGPADAAEPSRGAPGWAATITLMLVCLLAGAAAAVWLRALWLPLLPR